MAVDGQAEQVAVERLEIGMALGEGDEFGCAYGGKVGRMREWHQPPLYAVNSGGFEVRYRLVQTRHGGTF